MRKKEIKEYDKKIRILAQQRVNVGKAIREPTEVGWSGEARDKFIELHQRKQAQYEQLEAELQYMKNALENEIKPRAIKLKRRSEDFVNCIKRTGVEERLQVVMKVLLHLKQANLQ